MHRSLFGSTCWHTPMIRYSLFAKLIIVMRHYNSLHIRVEGDTQVHLCALQVAFVILRKYLRWAHSLRSNEKAFIVQHNFSLRNGFIVSSRYWCFAFYQIEFFFSLNFAFIVRNIVIAIRKECHFWSFDFTEYNTW